MPRPRLRSASAFVGITTVLALTIAAWAVGRVVSDRYLWSQWLLWIPTPAALAAAVAAVAAAASNAAAGSSRWRRGSVPWLVVVGIVGSWFTLIEHRLLHGAAEPAGLALAHWTRVEGEEGRAEGFADGLGDLGADVLIVTHPGSLRLEQIPAGGLTPEATMHRVLHFAVITALPIRQLRPLVATRDVSIALVEVDAGAILDRPLIIYLVDLPSSPGRSRAAVARRTRSLLDDVEAPPPDVVVGDFNITRGSVTLRRLMPGLVHAFQEGGHGYGASFHRRLPLYHIDHVLLGPDLDCRRYDLIDAGLGRHRLQLAYLVNAPGPDR